MISIAGFFFLEVARGTHDGTGGAHAADKMGDPPTGISPDLRACGLVVREWIIGVAKLVEDTALALFFHAFCKIAGELHATVFGCQDDLCAVSAHGLTTLERKMLGHDQDHVVATNAGSHRECDTRVAAGRLDQGIARFDFAACFSTTNHPQRWPVLD